MKTISTDKIKVAVADLCAQANFFLRRDVLRALRSACRKETHKRPRRILQAVVANAQVAQREKLAICQDTGLPVVFVSVGREVRINGDLYAAINQGVDSGYAKAFLRQSVVADPLDRGGARYAPAVVHVEITPGRSLRLTVLPKGFGCENKSQLKMFNPTVELQQIERFILDAVKQAGADACPPYVVGVGIGGTADYAGLLAKKALLRDIAKRNALPKIARLERELLKKINALDIGPMGLGGKYTALGVNVETYATHIAGLPVAVNISCHALRSAGKKI